MALSYFTALAFLVFIIGLLGFTVRRNAVVVLMCLLLMLNSACLLWVGFARHHASIDGQIAALFMMVVVAVKLTIGLMITVAVFKNRRTIDTDQFSELKL